MTAPARRCRAPGCPVAFVPARSDQSYCSNACRQRAHRKRASDAPEPCRKPLPAGGATGKASRRSVTAFEVPDDVHSESRRVLEYVNGEIVKWNSGERDEPLDLIFDAARERLRRHPIERSTKEEL